MNKLFVIWLLSQKIINFWEQQKSFKSWFFLFITFIVAFKSLLHLAKNVFNLINHCFIILKVLIISFTTLFLEIFLNLIDLVLILRVLLTYIHLFFNLYKIVNILNNNNLTFSTRFNISFFQAILFEISISDTFASINWSIVISLKYTILLIQFELTIDLFNRDIFKIFFIEIF